MSWSRAISLTLWYRQLGALYFFGTVSNCFVWKMSPSLSWNGPRHASACHCIQRSLKTKWLFVFRVPTRSFFGILKHHQSSQSILEELRFQGPPGYFSIHSFRLKHSCHFLLLYIATLSILEPLQVSLVLVPLNSGFPTCDEGINMKN